MLLLSCLILSIALMSWAIGQLRGDLLSRGVLKCLLFPSLIPDVLARTITCLATATPIRGLSPWKDGEPLLLEGDSPVRRLSLPLTSVLRVSVLIAASVTCVIKIESLSNLLPNPKTLEFAAQRGPEAFFAKLLPTTAEASALGLPALLAVAALAAMTLAAGLRNSEAVATLLVGGGTMGIMQFGDWIGLRFSPFSNGWFLQRFYEAEFGKALILLLIISLCLTVLLMLLHAVPASIGRLRPRPVSAQGRLLTRA